MDAVIADAVQKGWLDRLARGAQAERPERGDVQAATQAILAGVEAEGEAFYRQEAVGEVDDAVLWRQLAPHLATLQRRTVSVPLTGLDQSGGPGQELAQVLWRSRQVCNGCLGASQSVRRAAAARRSRERGFSRFDQSLEIGQILPLFCVAIAQ